MVPQSQETDPMGHKEVEGGLRMEEASIQLLVPIPRYMATTIPILFTNALSPDYIKETKWSTS